MIKLLFELVPLVGNVIDNIGSKDGGQGRIHTVKLIKSVTRLVLTIGILWLIFKGFASTEDLKIIEGF